MVAGAMLVTSSSIGCGRPCRPLQQLTALKEVLSEQAFDATCSSRPAAPAAAVPAHLQLFRMSKVDLSACAGCGQEAEESSLGVDQTTAKSTGARFRGPVDQLQENQR